ncbi:MAG: hypothetical protein U0174_16040 [Polyangiaceae bacterium]
MPQYTFTAPATSAWSANEPAPFGPVYVPLNVDPFSVPVSVYPPPEMVIALVAGS